MVETHMVVRAAIYPKLERIVKLRRSEATQSADVPTFWTEETNYTTRGGAPAQVLTLVPRPPVPQWTTTNADRSRCPARPVR